MTLVELMISMLILTLVCTAWLEIIGIQSAKKEARRREAVERLAGMMDAFMAIKKLPSNISKTTYRLDGLIENEFDQLVNYEFGFQPDGVFTRHYVFNREISPICYSLSIEEKNPLNNTEQSKDWMISSKYCYWLVGRLYGNSDPNEPAFFTLPVCLGFPM